MAKTLYVNKPGGVIARRQDGTGVHLAYGKEVPNDLHRAIDPTAFADETPRIDPASAALEQEAHRRAALAEGGQPNSGSSPVPGNYNELDEDGAAILVQKLEAYPEQQAQVLVHEILYMGGRKKVTDAASEYARTAALAQLADVVPQLPEQTEASLQNPQTGFGDPRKLGQFGEPVSAAAANANQVAQRMQEDPDFAQKVSELMDKSPRQMRVPRPSGGDSTETTEGRHGSENKVGEEAKGYGAFRVEQLNAYIEQHGLDVDQSLNKNDKIAAIQQHEGHEDPQTPPQ